MKEEDKQIYSLIKDELTLEEAKEIYFKSVYNSYNRIEETEEERILQGKALIILEYNNELEEVRELAYNKFKLDE